MLKEEMQKIGIGNTIFTRSRNIEKLLGFSKLFLKFEGGNPTGTMKDRASYACLKLAESQGYDKLAIASCGNFGASFVGLAPHFGIEAHVFIPEGYHTPRISEMRARGGVINRASGTYEEVVEYSGREAVRRGWFNANPGVEAITRVSMEAYSTISHEIYDRLGYAPNAVAVPVGNGTTLAGIHEGFAELMRKRETERVPAMIGASTPGGNPVMECFLEGERSIRDIDPSGITETEYNEPLVSWRSLDGQEAINALWESGGWAAYVSDEKMLEFSEILAQEEGLWVLPASASALVALAEYASKRGEGGAYVAVLTGRKG